MNAPNAVVMSHKVTSIEPSAMDGGTGRLRSGIVVMPSRRATAGDILRPHFIGHFSSDRVEREREGRAQRHRAAIAFVIIARTPAIDHDRLVIAHIFGAEAVFQRGGVNERLERRTRLAARLHDAVELGLAVIGAADQRAHRALAVHHHRGGLQRTAPEGAVCRGAYARNRQSQFGYRDRSSLDDEVGRFFRQQRPRPARRQDRTRNPRCARHSGAGSREYARRPPDRAALR